MSSSKTSSPAPDGRPRALKSTKSFSKPAESNGPLKNRPLRASTIQNGSLPDLDFDPKMPQRTSTARSAAFAKMTDSVPEEEHVQAEGEGSADDKLPLDFDSLPIELASLTDTFIDSLSAKVHPNPPTIDVLSGLFQDFYVTASTHISTHIAALSSKLHRQTSRQPSPAPSLRSASSIFRSKAPSISLRESSRPNIQRRDSDQQMLSASEIADRKKQRKLLEQKRVALEEAVERRVCEGVYDRIWRHRSTQDEAQDEKLRSRAAALSVVGIGLTDLSIDLGNKGKDTTVTDAKQPEVRERLEGARSELRQMNSNKYPLGKLQHLKAAVKEVVDTLAHFHPSSSADEILPMFIYTLITSPPEGSDVISNLYFVQRFRNEAKIDGEAAYCLTTLEAAITFCETAELASLRADESLAGPGKLPSRPATPQNDTVVSATSESDTVMPPTTLVVAPITSTTTTTVATANSSSTDATSLVPPGASRASLRPLLSPQNRRLSDMFQPQAQALGDASDAVFKSADQGIKTIGNSLGDSYKFFIGKLKERQEHMDNIPEITVPRTLDEARRLVGTPPPLEEDDKEEQQGSKGSSIHSIDPVTTDDKLMNLIGGKRGSRRNSIESNRSVGSAKKVGFAEDKDVATTPKSASPLSAGLAAATTPAIAETMRNIGNSFNPMSRLAGMGMMKGFSRQPAAAASPSPSPFVTKEKDVSTGESADSLIISSSTTISPISSSPLPPPEQPKEKISPPLKRFMELENPGELKINEVLELLRDYRRLGNALKDLGAC